MLQRPMVWKLEFIWCYTANNSILIFLAILHLLLVSTGSHVWSSTNLERGI